MTNCIERGSKIYREADCSIWCLVAMFVVSCRSVEVEDIPVYITERGKDVYMESLTYIIDMFSFSIRIV